MYQKILVPLDGSSLAESVLPHVRALASTHNAEVVLLQVIVDPIYDLILIGPKLATATHEGMFSQREGAQTYLDCLALQLREHGVRVTTLIAEGMVVEKILDCAKQVAADVIVLTTHGHSLSCRWKLGNVTYRLVHDSEIPVLLVRAQQSSFQKPEPALAITRID